MSTKTTMLLRAATLTASCGLASGLFTTTAEAQRYQRVQGLDNFEKAYSVWPTKDGGSYTTGAVERFVPGATSSLDVLITRHDADGSILWQATFGDLGRDIGYSIQETEDGGAIVAAESDSFGPDLGILLIRVDASGGFLWSRAYTGTIDSDTVHTPYPGVALDQGQQGHIAVVGSWRERPVLFRTDAAGNLLFHNFYFDPSCGAAGNEVCFYQFFTDVQFDTGPDGEENLVVSGTRCGELTDPTTGDPDNPFGGPFGGEAIIDPFLFRTTGSGAPIVAVGYEFMTDFNSPDRPNTAEWGHGLDIREDGAIVLGGRTNFGIYGEPSPNGGPVSPLGGLIGTYHIVTDPGFGPAWSSRYSVFGSTANEPNSDMAYAAVEFNDFRPDAIVHTGTQRTPEGPRAYVQETEAFGSVRWNRSYGASDVRTQGESVKEYEACGYTMAGSWAGPAAGTVLGSLDVYLVKTNDRGDSGCFQRQFEVGQDDEARPYQFQLRPEPVGQDTFIDGLQPWQSADLELCFDTDCNDQPCPTDLNGDGVINVFDLITFLTAFDPAMPSTVADLEPFPGGDGDNDVFDLIYFLSNFTPGPCP